MIGVGGRSGICSARPAILGGSIRRKPVALGGFAATARAVVGRLPRGGPAGWCNAGDLIKVYDSRNRRNGLAAAMDRPRAASTTLRFPKSTASGTVTVRQRGGDPGRQRVTTAMVIAGG